MVFLFPGFLKAQKANPTHLDTLLTKLAKARPDTNKFNLYVSVFNVYATGDKTRLPVYAQDMLSLAQQLKWKKGIAMGYRAIAFAYINPKGNYTDALKALQKALTIARETGDGALISKCYSKIGDAYLALHQTTEAVTYYKQQLEFDVSRKNIPAALLDIDVIGNAYYNVNSSIENMAFMDNALKDQRLNSNAEMKSRLLVWTGVIYDALKDYTQAIARYKQALALVEHIDKIQADFLDDKIGVDISQHASNNAESLQYLIASVTGYEKTDYKQATGNAYIDLAGAYQKSGNYSQSLVFLQKAAQTAKETDDADMQRSVYSKMAAMYTEQGKQNDAENYYNQMLNVDIAQKNDAGVLADINAIGNAWYNSRNAGGDLAILNQVLKNPQLPNSDIIRSAVLTWTGVIDDFSNEFDKAIAVNKQAVALVEHTDDVQTAFLFDKIGNEYLDHTTDIAQGIKYLNAAVERYKKVDNKDNLAVEYNDIATGYERSGNYPEALNYEFKSLALAEKTGNKQSIGFNYNNIGSIYNFVGDHVQALSFHEKALKLYEGIGDKVHEGTTLESIGIVYDALNQYAKALEYYIKALKYEQEGGATESAGNVLGNIGYEYNHLKDYPRALENLEKAGGEYKQEQDKLRMANTDGNIGEVYVGMAQDKARSPEEKKQFLQKAIEKLDRAAQDCEELHVPEFSREFYGYLSTAYEMNGEYAKALAAHKQNVMLKDSLVNQENTKEITRHELNYEYGRREDSIKLQQTLTAGLLREQTLLSDQQKQKLLINQQSLDLANRGKELELAQFRQSQASLQSEQNLRKANQQQLITTRTQKSLADKKVQLQNIEIETRKTQTYYLFAGIAALLALSFFIAQNYRNQKKSNSLLTASNKLVLTEKKRSDDLLLNILPADVAEELKEKGSANARLFDEVTVLFTDFVNFTTVSEQLSPQQLVDELNECFMAFDHIMQANDTEKIKTIGDAYLAVSGLPNAQVMHAANAVKAAQEIQRFMLNRKQQMGDKTFAVRIGVHSGSVVAGIVGVKKFAYDVWGDTVNTAARMEQNSQPGKINVSEKTYELVKDQFAFTYRGEIEAKNKGAIKMYFVEEGDLKAAEREKVELSI